MTEIEIKLERVDAQSQSDIQEVPWCCVECEGEGGVVRRYLVFDQLE